MIVLRRLMETLARIDPGLWYLLDLRRRSAASWIPAVLLIALFASLAVGCLAVGNIVGASILAATAVTLLAAKLQAAAHG